MRKMISFVNFARIARICMEFNNVTLHGYFFPPSLLAKFEFLARTSNKPCLNLQAAFCNNSNKCHSHLLKYIFA